MQAARFLALSPLSLTLTRGEGWDGGEAVAPDTATLARTTTCKHLLPHSRMGFSPSSDLTEVFETVG